MTPPEVVGIVIATLLGLAVVIVAFAAFFDWANGSGH